MADALYDLARGTGGQRGQCCIASVARADAPIPRRTGCPVVTSALRAVRKCGRVVCAGIHMSDIPSFPYRMLWEERELLSVANLTRKDGLDFLQLAPKIGIKVTAKQYPLRHANQALDDLRNGRFEGAAVLMP